MFRSWILSALIAVFAPLQLSAAPIGFDELEQPGTSVAIFGPFVDIGDFRFASTSGGFITSFQTGSTFYARTGSASLSTANSANLLVTRLDGGAFSANSVEVDAVFQQDSFVFEANDGAITQVFEPDFAPGNQLVTLNGFGSITSLTISGEELGLANFGAIDNINLGAATAVPLPAPAALLIFSLVGLASLRRVRSGPAA